MSRPLCRFVPENQVDLPHAQTNDTVVYGMTKSDGTVQWLLTKIIRFAGVEKNK
jgi:hypothetical protein